MPGGFPQIPQQMSLRITEYRMTKSIQQIKQNLDYLESTVAETAVELQDLYRNYLNLLSQSVKQQLILASYQICTQFYPQSFLKLSLSNKQILQQEIRQIGAKVKPNFLKIVEQTELEPESRELNLMAELIKNLPKPKKRQEEQETDEIQQIQQTQEANPEIDLESVAAELENIEFIEIDTTFEDDSPEESSSSEIPESTGSEVDFNNPEHLILWQKQVERAIKKTLDYTSKKTNRCLQNSEIIPNRIPSKIIDVAIQTDSSRGGRNNRKLQNIPNILHLAIETDQDPKSSSSSSLAQISLLRLRLAEIEFSDPMLNAKRGQIRNLVSKISNLKSKYQLTKQEYAVAEAQAAWRSSWYED